MSTLRRFKSLPDLVLARESHIGWGDWRVGRSTREENVRSSYAREEKGVSDEGQEGQRNLWGSQAEVGSCYQQSKRLFKAGAGLTQLDISVLVS